MHSLGENGRPVKSTWSKTPTTEWEKVAHRGWPKVYHRETFEYFLSGCTEEGEEVLSIVCLWEVGLVMKNIIGVVHSGPNSV